MESFIRHLARELGSRHQVKVLSMRADDGPANRLSDSLRPPPTFAPFRDGPVLIEPLRISQSRRIRLAPLYSQVMPGLRRYAYGRARLAASALYAAVVAPIIAPALREADVAHMWGGDLVAWAAVQAARQTSVPVIITPFAHRHQWGDDLASAAAYRKADWIIALQEWDAALYRELGVNPDRIAVCGVCSPGLPAGGGQAMRIRYGIDGPLVLYLGVRRDYKGFGLLLAAAPHVAQDRPDVTFAFLGPGVPIASVDARPRILDIGFVDDGERAAWLDAADLLCLPSEGEILPLAILEAWSLGKPVVTSDIPPLRDLLQRSGGGISVPRNAQSLARAIVDLVGHPERMHAMGKAGFGFWSADHRVPTIARWHEQLYAKLSRAEAVECAS